MNSKKLFVCHTYYHILISIIKALNYHNSSDIVICDTIPDSEMILERVRESKIFNSVLLYSEKSKEKITLNQHRYGKIALLFINKEYKKKFKPNFEISSEIYSNIYLFNDWTFIGYYLRASKLYYNLLEDAKDSYKVLKNYVHIDYKKKVKHRVLSRVYETLFFYGKSKYSKTIEVNDPDELTIPSDKIVVKRKKDLFSELSENEKEKIYLIFTGDSFKNIPQSQHSILLLTQPLFQDGLVKTFDSQKKVYDDILSENCHNEIIVIKPHPRDTLNYNEIFPSSVVIDKNIPIEVLDFNPKVKIKKAITISSSSIYGIDFVEEKIYLGFEWLEKYK